MIKKTLVLFFILFGAYTIMVSYIADPDRYISEHQWQDNQIKTQKYLFTNTDSIDAIIAGSSLSERLHMNMLPRFYNLGLLGLGPIDGLSAIQAKGRYPKYIFIEINHIDRPLNYELKNSIENPVMMPLRKQFISLRDGKQPMGFIAIPYGQKATAYGVYLLQTALSKMYPSEMHSEPNQSNMLDKMVAKSIEYHNQIPKNLKSEIQVLKQYIADMSEHGSTIIFFEMPVHPQLYNLARSQAVREAIYKIFSGNNYLYIDCPHNNDYTTTDGEHLDFISAQKYTEYFVDQINKLRLN